MILGSAPTNENNSTIPRGAAADNTWGAGRRRRGVVPKSAMRRSRPVARRTGGKGGANVLLAISSLEQLERLQGKHRSKLVVVVVTGAPTEYASQAFLGELQQRLRQARARGMSAADAATVYLHASSDEVKARLRRYYAKTGGPAGGFSVPSAVLFAGKTHVRTVTERDVSKLLALVTAEARVRHSEKSERFARIGGPALWLAKRGAAAYVALTLAGGIIRPALRTVVYGVKALFPKSEPAYKFRPAENAVRQRTVYESFSDIRQAAAEASAAALGDDAYVRPATDPIPTEPFASIRQLERRAARSEATKSYDSIQATYNRDVPTREEVERFVWGDVQR